MIFYRNDDKKEGYSGLYDEERPKNQNINQSTSTTPASSRFIDDDSD